MPVLVYPSRLEGDPLEIHETADRLAIAEWMHTITAGAYSPDAHERHPTITLNGEPIAPERWALTFFEPSDVVRIYIEPKGTMAIVVIASVLISAAVTLLMTTKPQTPQQRQSGRQMGGGSSFANTIRWGEPIPEIAGAPIVFPDYLAPPFRRFEDYREQWFSALLCVGAGEYEIATDEITIGETPITSMEGAAQVQIYPPGATLLPGHAEWWHSPEEVGFTTFGGSGLAIGERAAEQQQWEADLAFDGDTITGSAAAPATWEPGVALRIEAATDVILYTRGSSGANISSPMLDALNVQTGDRVEVPRIPGVTNSTGIFTVGPVMPPSGGSIGAPGILTGSAPPSRLDFGVTPASFEIMRPGVGGGSPSVLAWISLTATVADVAELAIVINSQLNATKIRAREAGGGVLELYQIAPYDGLVFFVAGGGAAVVLGSSPSYTAGVATLPPLPAQYHLLGASFGGGYPYPAIAPRTVRAAVGLAGMLFEVVERDGNAITVKPADGRAWSGFPASVIGSASAVKLGGSKLLTGWLGWFSAVPVGEVADRFEVDIFYPQGLIAYSGDGSPMETTATAVIQWRYVGDDEIHESLHPLARATPDQIGVTHTIELPTPGRIEVRVSGTAPSEEANTSNAQQWSGLRARIVGAPLSYPGITTMHVKIRSGDSVSGAAESKVSLRPVRILPTVENQAITAPTRDIAPFFLHMMQSVGYGRDLVDMSHLQALHNIWSQRGDTYDLSHNKSGTLKTAANQALAAGFAELTIKAGKISAARDALRVGPPSRIYGPNEIKAGGEVVEATQLVTPDDIDGVDLEYIDHETGREVTVEYRLPGVATKRVETISAPGVTGRAQAWRLAARHLRREMLRRTTYTATTELAALNSYYLDHIGLQDGIPEYGQTAFVLAVSGLVLTLSEPVTGEIMRIRRPDGTATNPIPITAIDGRMVTLAEVPADAEVTANPDAPTVVYCGAYDRITHEALVTEIAPTGDGSVSIKAVRYDTRIYAEDGRDPEMGALALTPLILSPIPVFEPPAPILLNGDPLLTSKPYASEAQSAAGATFNVSANFSRPVLANSTAGLSAVTLSAKLRTTTSYGSYTQPKPHPAAGLSAVTLSAKLRTTTSYGSYTQPAPHPTSGLSAVTLSAKLKRVIVEAPTPPEAVGATFTVGVTFDR